MSSIDGPLTIRDHVLQICRTSFYQLCQLCVIRGSFQLRPVLLLSWVVHAFVSSRLDYCNSLLAGLTDELTNKLQSVLRSEARLILRKLKFDPITDDLRDRLLWLPICQRIQYKLGVLVYKCLPDMISRVGNGCQRLRSATRGNLAVPRTRTVCMGPQSFAVSGPTLWNSLPVELKTTHIPLETLKSKLKTYLFTIAYDQ